MHQLQTVDESKQRYFKALAAIRIQTNEVMKSKNASTIGKMATANGSSLTC